MKVITFRDLYVYKTTEKVTQRRSKMPSRFFVMSREKLFSIFVVLILVVSCVYLYLIYLQEHNKSAQWSGNRCLSEISLIKYQLNEVTEYKNRIEIMLTEAQQKHSSEKQRFKDIIDTCITMRQQVHICQSQFEDLQSECKRIKEELTEARRQLSSIP